MGRYKKVEVCVWGDAKFRALSKPQPNAQSLWFYLLTGPHNTSLPGLSHIGEYALAENLEWPIKAFRKCMAELVRLEMVKVDWTHRVVWLPNAIKHNPPESPNVVKGWADRWEEIPDCDLKVDAYRAVSSFLETQMGGGFGKAFLETIQKPFPLIFGKSLGKASGKTMPNQEQEQEQEQEQDISSGKASTKPPLPEGFQEDPRKTSREPNPRLQESFNAFWSVYPRRVKRGLAFKSWQKLNPSEELLGIILAAVERQKTWDQWKDPQYIPHPTTWLNEERWLDEDPPGGPGKGSAEARKKAAVDRLKVITGTV